MKQDIYDLVIIGGGPAGIAAGVYAARKKIKALIIAESFRGQSAVSGEIQNWIGEVAISGEELSRKMENHLKRYADDIEIKEGETVTEIKKVDDLLVIVSNRNSYSAQTVLICTGNLRKKLSVKGADVFEGKGITYCATCDGPLFGGLDVAVIGGGNSAFEAASQLLAYAKSVTIMQRSDFRAESITVEKILSQTNVKGLTNVDLLEIKGDKFVSSIVYQDRNGGPVKELPVQGIFVEIGSSPAVSFIKEDFVKLDEQRQIIIDPHTQKTSQERVWAAGDCTDGLYRQNNIAVGDAIKAVEDIYRYLKSKK